jgi:hypothetical protein
MIEGTAKSDKQISTDQWLNSAVFYEARTPQGACFRVHGKSAGNSEVIRLIPRQSDSSQTARLAAVASRFPLTAWMADGAVGDVTNDGPEVAKSPHEL